MELSVLSWNVEHFDGKGTGTRADRVDRVANFIKDIDPDIFAVMEVEGAMVFNTFTSLFPGYTLFITEGRQSQEIMVGFRDGLSAFVTQRTEFKRNNPFLRPGTLVTLTDPGGGTLPILFTHLKSFPSPEGFGLRDAMYLKARNLKKKIDERLSDETGAPPKSGRFILVGDLNTQGLNLTFSNKDLTSTEEIERLDEVLGSRNLERLDTTHPFTFNDGSQSTLPQQLLDHVYASSNLSFADMGGAPVRVAGWPERPTIALQDQWIDEFSDHAPLIFKVLDV
ncbi:MAG: endonuclease/exonuclease/phosphatase family protein [Rhodobacter sp.]|nr:endonuclease/exonuclease/phosphatase family protein [Rhodobacter sp.]